MRTDKKPPAASFPNVAVPHSDAQRMTQVIPQSPQPTSNRKRAPLFPSLHRPGSSALNSSQSALPKTSAPFAGKFAAASQNTVTSRFKSIFHSKQKSGPDGSLNTVRTASQSLESKSAQRKTSTAVSAYEAEIQAAYADSELETKGDSKTPATTVEKYETLSASERYRAALLDVDEFADAESAGRIKTSPPPVRPKYRDFSEEISVPVPELVRWKMIKQTNSVTMLKPEQIGLIGAMRLPNPLYDKSEETGQADYGNRFFAEVESAGKAIRQGEIKSIGELWKHATDWRYAQAVSSSPNDRQSEPFRLPVDNLGSKTELVKQYAYIEDRLVDKKTLKFEARLVKETLDGLEVSLTSIVGTENSARIFHTRPHEIPRIMSHVNSLARDFLVWEHQSESQVMSQLGTIHWWLANAMPNQRGSAACSEVAVRALAHATGRVLPPFKKGFVSDLEAMVTDREVFAASYENSFERNSQSNSVSP